MTQEKINLINHLQKLSSDYEKSKNLEEEMKNPKIVDDFKESPMPKEPKYLPEKDLSLLKKPTRAQAFIIIVVVLCSIVIGGFIPLIVSGVNSFPSLPYKTSLTIQISIMVVCAFLILYVTFINPLRYRKNKSKYDALVKQNEEIKAKNLALKEEYESQLQIHEQSAKIHEQVLQNKKQQAIKDIKVYQYEPLLDKLDWDSNEVISEQYFDKLPEIIELLKNGRAETLNDALDLIQEKDFKDAQLDLQRQRLAKEQELLEATYALQERIAQEQKIANEQLAQKQKELNDKFEEQKANNEKIAKELCKRCTHRVSCPMKGTNPSCPAFNDRRL